MKKLTWETASPYFWFGMCLVIIILMMLGHSVHRTEAIILFSTLALKSLATAVFPKIRKPLKSFGIIFTVVFLLFVLTRLLFY